MTLAKAIKLLTTKYERAKTQDWIHRPLACALYQVWQIVNVEDSMEQKNETVEDICDNYCKFPEHYGDSEEDREQMFEEHCDDCPMKRLWRGASNGRL